MTVVPSTASVPTTALVALQTAEVIRQASEKERFKRFVGAAGDKSSLIYSPRMEDVKANTFYVPLRRVDTTASLDPGSNLEEQGTPIPFSTSYGTIAERVQVFQEAGEYEKMKTVINTRKHVTQDASDWIAAYTDKFLLDGATVTTPQATFPEKGSRSDSAYNVEYAGPASDWDNLATGSEFTFHGLMRMKNYMEIRGIRPARFGGRSGYLLILPSQACYQLQIDTEFVKAAQYTLPRSEDHPFWSGWGEEFFARVDNVWIFKDLSPAFGGSDATFLHTESAGDLLKCEGLFMGAQALAYAKTKGPIYFERVWNHNQNFECSIRIYDGICVPTLNLGAVNTTTTTRQYGLGYWMGVAPNVE